MYSIFLFMHVFSVILSIGPFFVFFPLLKKMRQAENEQLNMYLDTFQHAVRISKHAGHILVISGVLLVWNGNWSWLTSWLVVSILILLGALSFMARAFSPIIRKMREPDHDRNVLVQKLTRATILYIFTILAVMWLMISKPAFW